MGTSALSDLKQFYTYVEGNSGSTILVVLMDMSDVTIPRTNANS